MSSISKWLCVLIMTIANITGYAQEELIINPDLLNLESIRQEENLSNDSVFRRVYVFVAKNVGNNQFEGYVANGTLDTDNDGKPVVEEPNDLEEYEKLDFPFIKNIKIEDDSYTCFITALPKFQDLFPNELDPFEDDSIVEVVTELKEGDTNYLEGTTTIPLVDSQGNSAGVERYSAFYKREVQGEGDQQGVVVKSFGFIHIQIQDAG